MLQIVIYYLWQGGFQFENGLNNAVPLFLSSFVEMWSISLQINHTQQTFEIISLKYLIRFSLHLNAELQTLPMNF